MRIIKMLGMMKSAIMWHIRFFIFPFVWFSSGKEGYWGFRRKCLSVKSRFFRRQMAMLHEICMNKFGSFLPLELDMKYPPCFPHGITGVHISVDAVIGRNVVIFQQVTIGSNTLPDNGGGKAGAPRIGDNVYIGAGAKIIGDIIIGDNCRIGANCCVYKSMPPHSVAVLAPTRIIQKEALDNRFFSKEGGRNLWFCDGYMVEEYK